MYLAGYPQEQGPGFVLALYSLLGNKIFIWQKQQSWIAQCKTACQHQSQLFQENCVTPLEAPTFSVFINSVSFYSPQNTLGFYPDL